MHVVIAGGHGSIALIIARLLSTSAGSVTSLIRNPEHADDVRDAGADPLVLDLETASVAELATALEGADAAVFAAGAGPNSGAARKLTVDRDGAIKLADAAVAAGVRRLVVISAIGADAFEPESDDVFQVYLRAKSDADAYVRGTDLDWTIVRPGGLTDAPATDRVRIGDSVERGTIPRADVAELVVRLLVGGIGIRRQVEVVSGDESLADLDL